MWKSAPILIETYNWHMERRALYKEYLSKGIYEIENDSSGTGFLYYMICEPPTDRDELKLVADRFLEENNVIESFVIENPDFLKEIYSDGSKPRLWIQFIKPSKEYPIGHHKGTRVGFFGNEIDTYSILTVSVGLYDENEYGYSYYYSR